MHATSRSMRLNITRSILVLPLASFLLACSSQGPSERHESPTFGTITVDLPEIYSRERLVNDRFRQEAWLLERLKQADRIEFGLQGSIGTQDVSSFEGEFRGEFSPSPGINSESSSSSGDYRQTQRNHRTRQETQNEKMSRPNNIPSTTVTPIDEFRDYLAYIEEIRTEIIETQLDDRHDLDGNTLYLLKFDATINPGANTTAWAQIDVKLSDPLAAFGDGIGDAIPTENEGDAAETVVADERNPSKAPNSSGGGSPSPHATLEAQRELYLEWINSLSQRLNNELRNKLNGVKSGRLHSRELNAIRGWALDRYGYRLDEDTQTELLKALTVKRLASVLVSEGFLEQDFLTEFINDGGAESRLVAEYLVDQYVTYENDNPNYLGDYIYLRIVNTGGSHNIIAEPIVRNIEVRPRGGEDDTIKRKELPCDPKRLDFNLRHYDICQEDLEFLQTYPKRDRFISIAPRAVPLDDNPLPSAGSQPLEEKQLATLLKFERGLMSFVEEFWERPVEEEAEERAYAYVVTPKESAQRLSNRFDVHASQLLAASIGGAIPVGSASASAGWQKEIERLAETIERRPTVVGIAKHSGKEHAEFGWLIGPRKVSASSEDIRFQHLPARHSLSALLSVPAWWQEAGVEIRAYWLDSEGKAGDSALPGGKDAVRFTMRLPGDPSIITERLQRKTQRRSGPIVFTHLMPPVYLQEGQPASVLIPGRDLWRSTVVTIGSNKSNRITVLPNMEGIIADFPDIKKPPGLAAMPEVDQRDALRMFVWTSEGMVEIDRDEVKIQIQSSPGASEAAVAPDLNLAKN